MKFTSEMQKTVKQLFNSGQKPDRGFGFVALLCAIVLLQACNSTPTQAPAEQPQADTEGAAVAIVISPNPYTTDRPSVSGAARSQFKAALTSMNQKKWAQALSQLNFLAESYPDYSGIYLNVGICHRELGDAEKAEASFREAIRVNQKNIYAYNELGILLRNQGKFAGAETEYRNSLAVWPDHAESHLNLGILYDLYMGKWAEALEHYQMYQRLQSEQDRQVQGWIVDLNRRMDSSQQLGANQ